jgi:hypothetical protein
MIDNPPLLEVYKAPDWPTWLVRIGDGVYEMDARATQPSGGLIYSGRWSALAELCEGHKVGESEGVPIAVWQQAFRILGILDRSSNTAAVRPTDDD